MFRFSAELLAQIYTSRIMIVDDNEINRAFIEKALHTRGFTTFLSAGSAEEALKALDKYNPDIIILDVVMPGMDGFDCCEAIRKDLRHSDVPIIIQTTLTVPEMRYKAFVKGAADFVGKPLYPDELCARVIVHLERRLYLKKLLDYQGRIANELEEARLLQYAILPDELTIADAKARCHLDINGHLLPCSEVGGDFWGMKTLFPGQVALWIADLSGHGMAGALNAFRLQAHLKDHSDLTARPGEYLAYLNDKLLHLLAGGQFAAMFYAIIDTKNSQMHYATACVPHPILLHGRTGKIEIIDGSGFPLGLAINKYETKTIPFTPGDCLLLYSDVLTETPNGKGELISEEALGEILVIHKKLPSEGIKQEVLTYFYQHSGGVLNDDLSIVVCKY